MPLVTHPKVRMVSLTGSIATGSEIISGTADSVNACTWNWAARPR